MVLLSMIHASTTYHELIFGMMVLDTGVGLFDWSVTTAAITVLDPSESSRTGAVVYMFQIAGGSIGVLRIRRSWFPHRRCREESIWLSWSMAG